MGMGFGFSSAPLSYPSGMSGISQFNGSQYLQQSQSGLLYNTYTNPETFVPRNNEPIKTGENFSIRNSLGDRDYGKNLDATTMAFGEEGKSFRKSILDVASKTKESVVNSPTWIKGLASVGIMIVTIGCLLKGKKVPTPRAPEKTISQKFLSLFKK